MSKFNAFISYSHAADGLLAPQLQAALEKFAKPWYKIRNLNLFRDESNLSATPHLWSNIQQALGNSEYFIYLASPRAAESIWVAKEIEYWLESNPLDTFLVVLTEGDIPWDYDKGVFKNVAENSFPEILENRFTEEPFYIDLRDSKQKDELTLKHPIFKARILKLAAQLHGLAPKDLAGEEVKQHRKLIRIRNWAIVLLTGLVIALVVAVFVANKNASDLFEQVILTGQERDKATANFLIAEAQLERNPTKALQIAMQAYDQVQDSVILSRAYRIYRDHNIHTGISTKDTFSLPVELQFSADGNSFITHHRANSEMFNSLNMVRGAPLEPDEPTNGQKEKYVLRSLKGELIEEYSREFASSYVDIERQMFSRVNLRVDYDDGIFYVFNPDDHLVLIKEIPFQQHGASVKTFFIAPDNRKIVSLWNDGAVRIWDINTEFLFVYETGTLAELEREIVKAVERPLDYRALISVSPDGKKMLFSSESEIQYWDLENKGLLNSFRFKDRLQCINFSESGKSLLISTVSDGTYDWEYEAPEFLSPVDQIQSCNTSSEKETQRSYRIYGDWDEKLVLVTSKENEPQPILMANERIEYYRELLVTNKILTVSRDTLRLFKNPSYDPTSRTFLPPEGRFPKRDSKDLIVRIVFNQDETKMLVQSYDTDEFEHNFELWDLLLGERLKTFPPISDEEIEGVPLMQFSPDSRRIAITYGSMVTVWNCPKTLIEFMETTKK